MKNIIRSFLFILSIMLFFGCQDGMTAAQGEQAPDFTLPSISGESVTLSSLQGKKVLIDFFATWCPPCRHELAEINDIVNEYTDGSYEIVCVSVDSSIEKPRSFIASKGYDMTVLFDDKQVAQKYGVRGIPSLFLLDKNGKIIWHQAGAQPKEELIKLLELE